MEVEIKKKLSKRSQGRNLSFLRNGLGLKQADFGAIFGLAQSKICDLENSEQLPEKELAMFCDYFNVNPEFFDKFNFQDAMDSFANNINMDAKDNTAEAVNTADTFQAYVIEEANTTNINHPVKEIIEVTDKALALQKEAHEKEDKLKEEIFELRLQLALKDKEEQVLAEHGLTKCR